MSRGQAPGCGRGQRGAAGAVDQCVRSKDSVAPRVSSSTSGNFVADMIPGAARCPAEQAPEAC